MWKREDVVNFGAGPAAMPTEVLEEVRDELLNWRGSGMSVLEMSHRGAHYDEIHAGAQRLVRELLDVPDDFHTLFLQGGATAQFASIPMNLLGSSAAHCQYVVSGGWSSLALEEARRYTSNALQVCSGRDGSVYTGLPAPATWGVHADAAYTYVCENETVFGVETPPEYVPHAMRALGSRAPIVADVSSNFYSRPMKVAEYGVVYGGAQKNLGPAGLALLLCRKSLLESRAKLPVTPSVLDWKLMAANDSRYNTPPTFSIYVMGRCLEWLRRAGGVSAMEQANAQKARIVYGAIDAHPRYVNVVRPEFRSRMNVPFRIRKAAGDGYDETAEALFVTEAEKEGLLMLKGHRSTGGMRASLYNSVSARQAEKLVSFMERFADQHLKKE